MNRYRLAALTAGVGAAIAVLPAAASAATTKTVYVGPPPASFAQFDKYGDVDAFFLQKVTVNKGDTVNFSNTTAFHTVDIPAKHGSDLPLFVPGALVSGVNDANGNPFWFNGKVPALGFDPALFAHTTSAVYDGSKRVESGLPTGGPANVSVQFTKVGTYTFFCDVHPGMQGQVVVLPRKSKAPSKKKDAQALAKQISQDLKAAKRLATNTHVPKGHVQLGASDPHGVEIFAMFPNTTTVKRGTTVTFSMPTAARETHTASFGPQAYLGALSATLQGAAPSPALLYPSDPPGTITLTSTSHGNGFANTGSLDRDKATPNPTSNAITFTQTGTYTFDCLIHPRMTGTVIVK